VSQVQVFCPQCGHQQILACEVTVYGLFDGSATYRFRCPLHHAWVTTQCSSDAKIEFALAATPFRKVARPAELDEVARRRQHPAWCELDAELAACLLEDDEWLASAVAVLAKKYGERP
jgi:hypothetical protein